jgi:hypothetical protein
MYDDAIETQRSFETERYEVPYRFFLFKGCFKPEDMSLITQHLQKMPGWKYKINFFLDLWEHKFIYGASSTGFPSETRPTWSRARQTGSLRQHRPRPAAPSFVDASPRAHNAPGDAKKCCPPPGEGDLL